MTEKTARQTARARGLVFQRWIKKWLEDRGWLVRNFAPVPKAIWDKKKKKLIYISVKNDVWGSDLIARKEGRMLWIQASLDAHITKRVEEFEKYFKEFLADEDLMIWIKTDKAINIKILSYMWNFEMKDHMFDIDIGKIIRGKFYVAEGKTFEF